MLVPVVMGGPEPRVLFTRRSHNLRSHGGELSFPGGRADPGESPVETALRECWEEIGLDRRRVEIVGRLDVRVTAVSSAAIVPVVGIVDELGPLRPNPEEVEGVIEVPVRELLLPDISREERWRVASAEWSVWFFELVGDTLWGASAAILRELFCRILNLDPGDSDRHRFRFETDADQGDQLLGGQSLL